MAFWLPVVSLWRRELVRFARDRNRLFGAIGQPLVFWLLLGAGFEKSFAPLGISSGYLEYIYPGILLLILLFTAIFSTISVIEDRREGFMQSVLVAPVSRIGLVLGKVLGGGNSGLFGKPGISDIFGVFGYSHQHRVFGHDPHFLGCAGHCTYGFGLCDSLAGFIHCGISRGDEFVFIPHVGAVRRVFPHRRRVALAGIPDGNKSPDLWYGRFAPISLSNDIRH